MPKNVARGDPSGETIFRMIPEGTMGKALSKAYSLLTVRATFDVSTASDGTANAGFFTWINPEPTTILIDQVVVVWTKTGTGGTFDMGVGADGTGSSDIIFDGGTTDPGVKLAQRSHRVSGTGTGGTLGGTAWLMGPGGTGTGNSIVAKQSEVTSTAEGWVVISYYPVVGSAEN